MCLPSYAKLKTLTIYVVTHSTGFPRNEVCLLSFHFCIRVHNHSLKKVYKLPTSSQVPWYVTTGHPHYGLVDEPGSGCSHCWRQTVVERESPVLLSMVHLLLSSLCVSLLYNFTFRPFCRKYPCWHYWRTWKD